MNMQTSRHALFLAATLAMAALCGCAGARGDDGSNAVVVQSGTADLSQGDPGATPQDPDAQSPYSIPF